MSTPPPRRRWPFARRQETYVESAETVVGPPVPPPPNRLGAGLLLGLLLVLLAAGIIAAVYFLRHNDDETTTTVTATTASQVTVPKVVGLSESKALVALASAGLKPRERFQPSKKPTRVVISQAPEADTQVDEGSRVTIVVDNGAPKVAVPNVQGIAVADAIAKLDAQGLDAKQTPVSSTKPAGTVVTQAPAPETQIPKGSTVTLSVAKAAKVAVPDVTGQPAAAAATALKNAGLEATTATVPSADPKGNVVAQSPAAGTQVDQGSSVRINVSDGSGGGATTTTPATAPTTTAATTTARTTSPPGQSANSTVPDLAGMKEQQAVQSLATAGIRASIVFVPGQDPQGTVVGQGKPAGSTVPRNSHVQINVSTGPNPKPSKALPDTVGQTLTQAVSTLNAAGFKLIYVKAPVTSRAQAGKVVEQQPGSGTSVPQGVQVLVYLGAFRP